jgi:hypothetical protein
MLDTQLREQYVKLGKMAKELASGS